MTREEIKNLRELVDLMLDKCVLADSRTKVYKRLEEVCDLAIKAVEQESVIDKIRAEIAEYKDDKVIHDERNEMIDIVLDIIDKYKAESKSRK